MCLAWYRSNQYSLLVSYSLPRIIKHGPVIHFLRPLSVYRWDGSIDSLSSTLHLTRPDLFQNTDSPPIPMDPPPTITSYNKDEVKETSSKVCTMKDED